MPSPFPTERGTLRLLEPAELPCDELTQRLVDNRYDKPFVLDDGEVRMLLFRLDYIQSAMRLAEPHALDLVYTRKMMAFLLFHTNVRSLLLIGLGGGSLAKFCYRHLPQARITAVESDRHVIAFREQFMVPPDDERFTVVHADGAAFVADCRQKPDVMLIDAFDRDGFSPTISTLEFYENARSKLADNGILVANLTGETADRLAHVALISQAFNDNLLVIPVEDGFNHLVFAFRNPSFEPRWKWIATQVQAMRARFGLDFPAYATALERCRQFGSGRRTW